VEAKRLDFLDYARGIAALAVFFSHSLDFFIKGWGDFGNGVINFGQIGVVMFFMVSGFVIPISLENKGDQKAFWLSRVFRIYPLYLFVFLLGLILVSLKMDAKYRLFEGHALVNCLYHLFFIQSFLPYEKFKAVDLVGGSWTLFIEMIWYACFSLVFYIKFAKKTVLLSLMANSGLLLLTVVSFLLHKRIPLGLVGFLNLCVLGLVYNRFRYGIIGVKTLAGLTLVTLATLAVALLVAFGYHHSDLFSMRCVVISWSTGFVLFNLFFFGEQYVGGWIKTGLKFLGKTSYSMYLMHGPVLVIVMCFQLAPTAYIALHLLLTVFVSLVTYKLVEEKGVALGKRLAKRL
jgi:peptidoglycan/LPS O-acetylase OafA/YrhL